MHIEIARNRSILANPLESENHKTAARCALESIAADPSDRRQQDAAFVLRELGLTSNEVCTVRGQTISRVNVHENLDRDSEDFAIRSSFIRAAILMGMADANAAKTGGEPFEYPDEETRVLCHAWYEAWQRAKTVPIFWDLLDRTLSASCKSLLGFNSIHRPTEVIA